MKKILFGILLLCTTSSVYSQDDLYYSPQMKSTSSDSILIKSDVDNIRYCLGNYYKQRQIGLITSFSGASIGLISAFALNETSNAQVIGLAFSGIIGLTGTIMILDSEKWLKNASIQISPGSIKFKF